MYVYKWRPQMTHTSRFPVCLAQSDFRTPGALNHTLWKEKLWCFFFFFNGFQCLFWCLLKWGESNTSKFGPGAIATNLLPSLLSGSLMQKQLRIKKGISVFSLLFPLGEEMEIQKRETTKWDHNFWKCWLCSKAARKVLRSRRRESD